MIFTVDEKDNSIEKIDFMHFTDLRIWERKHLEEWIRKTPEILGEELLVVSVEFDRFSQSSDRLDILALDRQGNLVVVELKRDAVAGYADLQAIRYAAMVSTMTLEKLVPYYIQYRKKYYVDPELSDEQAHDQLVEYVTENEDFHDLSDQPRIVLCAEGFSQEITSTVLWLRKSQVDISCVSIVPYHVGSRIILVPRKIIPLPEASQYLIDIQEKEETVKKVGKSPRPRSMTILITNGILKEGDKIYLKNDLPSYLKYDPNDPIYHATITGKTGQSNAIRWDKDQKEYSISNLTWQIFYDLDPEHKDPGGMNGNWHWVNKDGNILLSLADDYLKSQSENL